MATFDYRKKDFIVTASDFDTGVALTEFPYLYLKEHQQTYSNIAGAANTFIENLKNFLTGVKEFNYKDYYQAGGVLNQYYLPYFEKTHHDISNSWQEDRGPIMTGVINKLTGIIAGAEKIAYPAAGTTNFKSFAGPQDNYGFTVNFDLLNTIQPAGDSGSSAFAGLLKNKKFMETFIKQNLHTLKASLVVDPPCIYEALIPGVRYSPVCVVSNLKIENIGNMNMLGVEDGIAGTGSGFVNYIYPDAWRMTITFTELINETREIYDNIIQGNNLGPGDATVTVRVFSG